MPLIPMSHRRRAATVAASVSTFVLLLSAGSPLGARTASTTANLIPNPSFETSLSGWNGYDASLSRVTRSNAPSGSYVAKVARTSGTYFAISTTGAVVSSTTAGETYAGAAYVEAASSSSVGKPASVVVRERSQSGTILHTQTSPSVSLSSSSFQRVATSYTPSHSGNRIDVYVIQFSGSSYNAFYTDNISLVGITSSATPTPTPTATATATPTATPAATPTPTPTPNATPTPTPSAGWTIVADDNFSTLTSLPVHWHSYNSFYSAHPYGSATPNCVSPSQTTVSGGLLRLTMQWKSSTCAYNGSYVPFTGWYTAGIRLDSTYVPSSNDSRVTIRWRVQDNGVVSHRVIPMRWPDAGKAGDGEEDLCEVTGNSGCTSFIHYGGASVNSQISHSYTVDLTQWHTWRFVQQNYQLRTYIDDMTTPVWTCTGTTSPACNSTSVMNTLRHVVLQQECASASVKCPAQSAGTEEIQIARITVENPA